MADVFNMSDVFISYSRRDKEFALRLFEALKGRDKEVWADFEDIPVTADWWKEIQAGIDAADTFIFIISPDSVRSDICRQEIDHARDVNKRFIPLLYRDVTEPEDQALMHSAISSHNWLFCRETDDFDAVFATLVQTLETDLDYNRAHTRLLVRAKEWDEQARRGSYLLRGDDLQEAESWLARSADKSPHPTTLQNEYINASRRAETARTRTMMGSISVALVITAVLLVFAVFLWQDAQTARDAAEAARVQAEAARAEAEDARQTAEQRAIEAQALALAATSGQALINNDPDLALSLALEAVEKDADQPQVRQALANASYTPGTRVLIDSYEEVVNRLAYSPDGRYLLTGSIFAGDVCLWEVPTSSAAPEAPLHCIGGGQRHAHSGDIMAVMFHPQGGQAATAAMNGAIHIWDMDPDSQQFGERLYSFIYGRPIHATIYNAAGDEIIFGTDDGQIGIWQPQADTVRYLDKVHQAAVTALALSPDQTILFSGDRAGSMQLWDLESGSRTTLGRTHPTGVMSLAFNADGTLALSSGRDQLAHLWRVENGERLATYGGHGDPITTVMFGPDGNTVITASWDNSLRLWDLSTENVLRYFYGHTGGVNQLAISPAGDVIVTGSFDKTIRFWNLHSYLVEMRLGGNRRIVRDLAYSPDGSYIVTAHSNSDVLVWDTTSGELRQTLPPHPSNPTAVAISHDSALAASASTANVLIVADVESGEQLWRLDLPERVAEVAFTRDNSMLVGSQTHRIVWWDALSGELLRELPYEATVLTFALSPDEQTLLLGLQGRGREHLHLVDAATGELIRPLVGHTDGVLTIAYSPDGTQAVTGSYDNTARLWDLATGEELHTFIGHSDRVLSAVFSPDGARVLTGSNDRSIRLWDAVEGFEIARYVEHADQVAAVAFSPDGTELVSGSRDTTIVFWRLPHSIPEMVEWAHLNRYVKAFSCSERNLYRIEPLCEAAGE